MDGKDIVILYCNFICLRKIIYPSASSFHYACAFLYDTFSFPCCNQHVPSSHVPFTFFSSILFQGTICAVLQGNRIVNWVVLSILKNLPQNLKETFYKNQNESKQELNMLWKIFTSASQPLQQNTCNNDIIIKYVELASQVTLLVTAYSTEENT